MNPHLIFGASYNFHRFFWGGSKIDPNPKSGHRSNNRETGRYNSIWDEEDEDCGKKKEKEEEEKEKVFNFHIRLDWHLAIL